MKSSKNPPSYINTSGCVNAEMIQEARRLEDNPEMIMRLIDLIFLFRDEAKDIPS